MHVPSKLLLKVWVDHLLGRSYSKFALCDASFYQVVSVGAINAIDGHRFLVIFVNRIRFDLISAFRYLVLVLKPRLCLSSTCPLRTSSLDGLFDILTKDGQQGDLCED